MKESHGNNDKDACCPYGTSEPKSDSRESAKRSRRICGTTERLGDDLPNETDESKDVTSSNPEVSLFSWRQLPEVRQSKFGL